MRIRTLIGLAVAAGVVAGMSIGWRERQRRGRWQARPETLPEPLQTWEGEGGGVPVAGGRPAALVEPRHDVGTTNGPEGEKSSLRDDPTPGMIAG